MSRIKLIPMTNDDGDLGWYLDSEKFYIDVEQDSSGNYSIYFRCRETGKELWLDGADK